MDSWLYSFEIQRANFCRPMENYSMPYRNLRIVKLTPIAIGICEGCNCRFHSNEPVEDNAELEIQRQFDGHKCTRQAADRQANRLANDI